MLQLPPHSQQLAPHRHPVEGGQVLLEVDPGLQLGQLVEQALPQPGNAPLQAAIDPRHGQLSRPAAAGGDHLGDGFGAGEVEAAVKEGPLAELPGPGEAGAGGQNQVQHPSHGDQTAMAVKLHHVLAGEAAG